MNRHHIAVVVLAACSTVTAAADGNVASFKPLPASDWDRAAAAHLLRRAGFGGTPAEVTKLADMGLEGAVDYLVDFQKIPYEPPPPPIDPLLLEPPDRIALRGMSEDERRAYQQEHRRAERQTFEETRLWWLDRMLTSPRPFEEKMTLFWHGHFTSGVRKVRDAVFMKEQNEFLRRHALDNFRELLLGISRDRAMLVYLDGNRNVQRQPNENYARELLELLTLGVGHYEESDVKAAARAFTGWGFDDEGFRFHPGQHDDGVKTLLGRTGNLDGQDVIEIIVEQPECSRHLARKLLEFFCRPDPDKRLVERFAAEIRREKFNLRFIMKTLFKSRAFYDAKSRGCLVKSPVELLVGAARELDAPVINLVAAERALAAMGQELMQPPNVKGWDGGAAWINTATLFYRYNVVGGLIQGVGRTDGGGRMRRVRTTGAEGEQGTMRTAAMMRGSPAAKSRRGGGGQPAYDPSPTLRAQRLTTAEEIVDSYTERLLAIPLPSIKRELLIRYLLGPEKRFDVTAEGAATRVRTMIDLLCSTPEYQMH